MVSLWLEVGQVLDLIVHIVEQNARMELILCHWLEGQLVGTTAHPEYHFFAVRTESHLYHIALRELECLSGQGSTFMLLF